MSDDADPARALPELLLPAGSFESALAAIEGGADALYFGFADFSARKQARNLDRLEYRRLLRHASGRGVKLYAALNTIVLERELEQVAELLVFLSRFPPDAIIVQDWGLARLARERFPALVLHASTQMAIRTPQAARLAARLGIRRVVLPRESSLADLRRFHAEVPELEFEVFVHGALCYSFSGLCLASGILVGRSGNRGECAQVCRSRYEGELPSEMPAYPFSCRDLNLTRRLEALALAGAASFKVEGRMKAPEYGYAVARLYRGLLDRLKGAAVSDEDLSARAAAADLAFARSPTEAWFSARGGERLIDPVFPGHRGVHAGRIAALRGGSIVADIETSLGLRDGVMIFEDDDPSRPLAFPVTGLRDARTGRELGVARAGSRVELDRSGSPRVGGELRRISARELDRRRISPEEYPARLQEIPATLVFEKGSLALVLGSPLFPGDRSAALRVGSGEALPLQRAKRPDGFLEALKIFEEPGESDFTLVPRFDPGAAVEVPSEGGPLSLAPGELFIPPSMLKREKNRLYAEARRLLAERCEELAAASLGGSLPGDSRAAEEPSGRAGGPAPSRAAGPARPGIPPRSSLVFPMEGLPSGMPFATPRLLREGAPLPRAEGRQWLPLAPLVRDDAAYEEAVLARAAAALDAGESIVLGLDALHHLALAERLVESLADRDGAAGRLLFYIDIHLYAANHLALETFASLPWLAPRLAFAYFYLEAGEEELPPLRSAIGEGGIPLGRVDPAFEPPLFLSLGCLRKHHAEGGVCPADCDRRWTGRLRDRERSYLALVDDCVSMLFRV